MPERTTALPTPGQVWEAFERSHRSEDDALPPPPFPDISKDDARSDETIAVRLCAPTCEMCSTELVPSDRDVCEECEALLASRMGAA